MEEFLDNKYTKIYNSIVNRAKCSRTLPTGTYVEKHHIIPVCLGGSNDKANLVVLTAREHFICHLLLTKMTEGRARGKMWLAVNMFTTIKNHNRKEFRVTARMYERIKIEVRCQHSIDQKGKTGHKHTEEYKQRMSDYWKGRVFDEEHKEKLSKSWENRKGHVQTEETRKKIGLKKKGTTYARASCIECRLEIPFNKIEPHYRSKNHLRRKAELEKNIPFR